jgi:hypothetical protein
MAFPFLFCHPPCSRHTRLFGRIFHATGQRFFRGGDEVSGALSHSPRPSSLNATAQSRCLSRRQRRTRSFGCHSRALPLAWPSSACCCARDLVCCSLLPSHVALPAYYSAASLPSLPLCHSFPLCLSVIPVVALSLSRSVSPLFMLATHITNGSTPAGSGSSTSTATSTTPTNNTNQHAGGGGYPRLIVTKQTCVNQETLIRDGVSRQISVVVKHSPFVIHLALEQPLDIAMPSVSQPLHRPLFTFHQLQLDAALLYDSNEDKVRVCASLSLSRSLAALCLSYRITMVLVGDSY